jgi:hypothetical protein
VLAQIRPSLGMWRLQLGAGAALFLGLPVLNVFTTHSHLVTLLQGRGPWAVAGCDLTLLALGSALALAAHLLARRQRASKERSVPVPVRQAAHPAVAKEIA